MTEARRRGMLRPVLAGLVLAAAALLLPAAPVDAQVPDAAGMMPAAEPPAEPEDSPVAPALQAAGALLVLGGGITVARGWVSPDRAG